MKLKIIFLLFVFSGSTAWAKCASRAMLGVPVEKCLSLQCPEGKIPGLAQKRNNGETIYDNGKPVYEPFCFACDSEEIIALDCVSDEEARKICPNRYISYGCGVDSVLECHKRQIKNMRKRTCEDPLGLVY